MPTVRKWLSEISVPLYIVIAVFATSGWIDVNGLFVELPLLVPAVPEGWALASYFAIIIQAANIGPIFYTLVTKFSTRQPQESHLIAAVILVSATSCVFIALFWDRTLSVGGARHSMALLILVAVLGLVDCTSTVIYLPYMAYYRPQYMTAFFLGAALGRFFPGIVGLIQGVETDPVCLNRTVVSHNETTGLNSSDTVTVALFDPPLFNVQWFFMLVTGMVAAAGACFLYLQLSPHGKRERAVHSYDVTRPGEGPHAGSDVTFGDECPVVQLRSKKLVDGCSVEAQSRDAGVTNRCYSHDEFDGESRGVIPANVVPPQSLRHGGKASLAASAPSNGDCWKLSDSLQPPTGSTLRVDSDHHVKPTATELGSGEKLTVAREVTLLLITAWANAMDNGILWSIQAYACLPYGSLAYSLSVRLTAVCNALACVGALFVPKFPFSSVIITSCLGTVLVGYQVFLSSMSPNPPLKGETIGVVLVVVTQVAAGALLSLTNIASAAILNASGGHRALVWCGRCIQIGSAVGALVMFLIINVFHLFASQDACSITSF